MSTEKKPPALTTRQPIEVRFRYRRRWLSMTLPAGTSFSVSGAWWEVIRPPLFSVRCSLWSSDPIFARLLSLDLACNEPMWDVYVRHRDLRSCEPWQEPAEEPRARNSMLVPPHLAEPTLEAIPADQRVLSADGSRVAGWFLASTREDRYDETVTWHIAIFDAASRKLVRWWPHSVHHRHDTKEESGSPITSVTFAPSSSSVLVVVHADGTQERLEVA